MWFFAAGFAVDYGFTLKPQYLCGTADVVQYKAYTDFSTVGDVYGWAKYLALLECVVFEVPDALAPKA